MQANGEQKNVEVTENRFGEDNNNSQSRWDKDRQWTPN
jgi:hypothetical protein